MTDDNNRMFAYEDLTETISFAGFDYAKWYEHERTVLVPRLQEAGFTDIAFYPGESDSFGPLTRICICRDTLGAKRRFIYG